jgi:hypothetical protein
VITERTEAEELIARYAAFEHPVHGLWVITDHESGTPFSVEVVYLCSSQWTTTVAAAQIREISASIGDSSREFPPRVKRA